MTDLRRLALLILSDLADMEPEALEKAQAHSTEFERRWGQVEQRLRNSLEDIKKEG